MSGLEMKYFVLKPKGKDVFAAASRAAMVTYALFIHNADRPLSDSLLQWAKTEEDRNDNEDFS